MIVKEIQCKSILTKTTIGTVDYCLNPYYGCQHGCIYCYCRELTKRFRKHDEPWGTYVDIKINAVDVLKKQLQKPYSGIVWLSSATDAYQPIEKKYKLTRTLLEELSKHPELSIGILTKGSFVTRDIDVFKKFEKRNIDVGFTINMLDDSVRRDFEPFAAPIKKRIEQLRILRDEGIPTSGSFGPVFPGITDVDELFKLFNELEVKWLFTEAFNPRGENWTEVRKVLENKYPKLLPEYEKIYFNPKEKDKWHMEQKKRIEKLSKKYGIPCNVYFKFREKFRKK